MVKIISRKLLSTQAVYDIGVERDHNFLLANGLVASNCFNKSHSTAYAYVTYQTSYLKANFPVEYMAALLTANSDDQDKVKRYIDSCQKIGIEVEQPDINRSGVDFTPANGKILFGLSAIRNVGQNAVESILAAREKAEFKSLADLCDRVSLHTVNSRSLEALIKCGAFDSIEPNRKQLLEDIKLVIPWAQSRAKDREIGQGNLFDLLGEGSFGQNSSSNAFETAPKAPLIADFSPNEKLQMEKELLGFYVSDHPLKALQKLAPTLDPPAISIGEIAEYKGKKLIHLIVMLAERKNHNTKNGDPMAFIKVEDLTGQIEGVVFPKSYATVEPFLTSDRPIIIKGKLEKKEDNYQILVDSAQLITAEQLATVQPIPQPVEQDETEQKSLETTEQVYVENKHEDEAKTDVERLVMVELTPQRVNDLELKNLQAILKEYSGDKNRAKVPVMAIVISEKRRAEIRLGQDFWVQNHQRVVEQLNDAGFPTQVKLLTNATNH